MSTLETDARSQLRVLIVEDSPGYRDLVREFLRLAGGFSVSEAGTIAAAEGLLKRDRVDCVLLDLSLPDAQNLEGLELIRAMCPDAAVVVLTGRDDELLAIEAVSDGAQDYLVKARVEEEDLSRALRHAVQRNTNEQELAAMALIDPLTGLPNRSSFMKRTEIAIRRARRRKSSIAVLFVDLDGFKAVNDHWGHDAGDRVLRAVTTRLTSAVRPGDVVARWGGDEFSVLCEDIESNRDAAVIAERLLVALGATGNDLPDSQRLGASIGIALADGITLDADLLIRDADAAMYRAKRAGGHQFRLVDASGQAEVTHRLREETRLAAAIERGEFILHWQPIVELPSGTIVGAEALARWQTEEFGLLPPSRFIPLAEESDLIVQLGEWVLREACREAAAWHELYPSLFFAVNVSRVQLTRSAFASMAASAVDAAGVRRSSVCLELTETGDGTDADSLEEELTDLRRLGFRTSLDDFGIGHSSMAALRDFPVDIVKIDGQFVRGAPGDRRDAAIVRATVQLGHAFGLDVIAEGVERAEQEAHLLDLGARLFQGFRYGRPQPAAAMSELLAGAGSCAP